MTKLLDKPLSITVELGSDGSPRRLTRGPLVGDVIALNRWLAQLDWWHRPVEREYWRVVLRQGILCEIYRDQIGNAWFLERVYD